MTLWQLFAKCCIIATCTTQGKGCCCSCCRRTGPTCTKPGALSLQTLGWTDDCEFGLFTQTSKRGLTPNRNRRLCSHVLKSFDNSAFVMEKCSFAEEISYIVTRSEIFLIADFFCFLCKFNMFSYFKCFFICNICCLEI